MLLCSPSVMHRNLLSCHFNEVEFLTSRFFDLPSRALKSSDSVTLSLYFLLVTVSQHLGSK